MIGYRGCYRYLHDTETFALELEMLARVREIVAEPARDDPVRADEVGARSLSRGDGERAALGRNRACGRG